MATLSHLHPYPAMVPAQLADDLAAAYVVTGSRMLDPFCGSGRLLLAAAACGGECVGVDVNPLAVLISRAKANRIPPRRAYELLHALDRYSVRPTGRTLMLLRDRRVPWFSPAASAELAVLVHWIETVAETSREVDLLAVLLSATARDVSYCRKEHWKLHRMAAPERASFHRNAAEIFRRRLADYAAAPAQGATHGDCHVLTGSSVELQTVLKNASVPNKFDVIITSPPYGDSKTTVQYGGISALCIGVISHISCLREMYMSAGAIDARSLGGPQGRSRDRSFRDLKRYWNGVQEGPHIERLESFAADLWVSCREVAASLVTGGRAVLIVGRRRTYGWRFHIDRLVIDAMEAGRCRLLGSRERSIPDKGIPRRINRFARDASRVKSTDAIVNTISREFILVFERC
jgi:site-specific DNA-methyltransferase (cytosine-N4-specific)